MLICNRIASSCQNRLGKRIYGIALLTAMFGLCAVSPVWGQSTGYPGNDLTVPPPPPPPAAASGQADGRDVEQQVSMPSSILLEYGQSTGRNEDIYTELDLGVGPNGGVLRMGYGKNEVDTPTRELFTETYYLSINGFVSDHVGLGFSYRSWGDSGDLKTKAFSGTASWYGQNSIYSLTSIFRSIELFTPFSDPDVDRITGTGNGIKGAIVHRFSDRLELVTDVLFYEYSLDMRILSDFSGVLTDRALELGSGFLDSNYRVELGYYFPAARVSGQWENSVSAIDGTDSNTLMARCDLYSQSGYQLYALGGRTITSNDLTSNFGRVGIVFQW